MSNYPFLQARHFTAANRTSIRVIVCHDMEAPEKGETAESVAQMFHTSDRVASAHYNVDSNSIVQSVLDKDVAYHAPGCNNDGIGIEHAGFAAQSKGEWLDAYSRSELDLSAKLSAELCKKYDIPAVHLTNDQLAAGKKGFVGHNQVSAVYKKTTHTDPGPNFPWDYYIQRVNYFLGVNVNQPAATSKPPFHAGIVPHGSYPDIAKIRSRFRLAATDKGVDFFDDDLSLFLSKFAIERGVPYSRGEITLELWNQIWK